MMLMILSKKNIPLPAVKNRIYILALALCGLYSLVLLHNIVPHIHFDDVTKSVVAVHDGHSHDNDGHHNNQENNKNWLNLLLALFGDASHLNIEPDHFDNYVTKNIVKVDPGQTITFTVMACALLNVDPPETGEITPTANLPHLLYDSILSSSGPLRGPPTVA